MEYSTNVHNANHTIYKDMLLTGAHLCEEGLGSAQCLMLVSVTCEGGCWCDHICRSACRDVSTCERERCRSLLICKIFEFSTTNCFESIQTCASRSFCCCYQGLCCLRKCSNKRSQLQLLTSSIGKPVLNICHAIYQFYANLAWHLYPEYPRM